MRWLESRSEAHFTGGTMDNVCLNKKHWICCPSLCIMSWVTLDRSLHLSASHIVKWNYTRNLSAEILTLKSVVQTNFPGLPRTQDSWKLRSSVWSRTWGFRAHRSWESRAPTNRHLFVHIHSAPEREREMLSTLKNSQGCETWESAQL